MRTLALCAALASILIAGCSGGSTTAAPTGTNKEPAASGTSALAGSYKGKLVPEGNKDDPAAKMAEGLANMLSPELEITSDNKFTLSVMGMPISGSVTQSGADITLTPEKVMGMTPEEFKKQNASSPSGMDPDMKPMKGTVAAGVIKIKDDKQGGLLEFVKSEPKKVGASTVAAGETKLVGAYSAKIDESKLKPEEKGMAAMASGMTLKLDQDNTFEMKMGMTVTGTWKLSGDIVNLTPAKDSGFSGPGGKSPKLKLEADGALQPYEEGETAPPFKFVKK